MSRQVPSVEPDDFFSHTRMSFGDHIEDLRRHLFRAIAGFLIAMIACFFVGETILHFMAQPVETQLMRVYKERWNALWAEYLNDPEAFKQKHAMAGPNDQPVKNEVVKKRFKLRPLLMSVEKFFQPIPGAIAAVPEDAVIELEIVENQKENISFNEIAIRKLGREPKLIVLKIEEGFFIWMKVCFVAGFVVASPWIFYQIWAFIAAGLYPHEKKLVNVYLPFAIALFIGGIIFAQYVVLPQAVAYLLWINDWLGVQEELRLGDWLNFALLVPIVFGVAFQTPLIMFLLDRVGIVTWQTYVKVRRIALFSLTIVAAMLCNGDMVSMIMMTLLLFFFYEAGILACRLIPKPPSILDEDGGSENIEV